VEETPLEVLMSTRRKQLGAGLAAAAVLGFGSYALGTQVGDGSASAEKSGSAARAGEARGPFGPGGGPGGLEDLADRLGVEESELRAALEDLRPGRGGEDHRNEFAAALAEALGLEQEQVTEALEQVHQGKESEIEDAIAESLAEELGLEKAAVSAALEKVGPPRGARRPGPPSRRALNRFHTRLARELGVSKRRLRNALEAARPDFGPGRGDRDQHLQELAQALGVSEDELESAMEEVRTRMEERWQERHDEFVNALAERLDIPVERVEEAFPGPPMGMGGPGGPGGPHGGPPDGRSGPPGGMDGPPGGMGGPPGPPMGP
jgi:transcriptional regulator with XRE-family HTH domain